MDILAIAALEAFDDESSLSQHHHQAVDEVEIDPALAGLGGEPASAAAVDGHSLGMGLKRKADVEEEEDLQQQKQYTPLPPLDVLPPVPPPVVSHDPPPSPPRFSASLANILSTSSNNNIQSTIQQQPIPQRIHIPPHNQIQQQHHQYPTIPYASTSKAGAVASLPPSEHIDESSSSSSSSMVYYGPPTKLSEDSGLIRCICPYDDDDGFTIQCERCFAWLHGLCVDISPETVPDIYTCPLCMSGGKIARSVEARAAKLQQLRKEAEDGLRKQQQRTRLGTSSTIVTDSGVGDGSNASILVEGGADGLQFSSELDEEYELLAKARGLAYQKSLDNVLDPSLPQTSGSSYYSSSVAHPPPSHTNTSTSTITTTYPSLPHTASKTPQTPFYQREQLPVQQHTLGPSPFLHPQSSSHLHHQSGQSSTAAGASSTHHGKRAGSVASNASNNSTAGNKRSKSSSPGGANLPAATIAQTANNAGAGTIAGLGVGGGGASASGTIAPPKQRKRSNHAAHSSLPSIPQHVAVNPQQIGGNKENPAPQGGLSQMSNTGMPVPPPAKKRRSASAKEKEKEKEKEYAAATSATAISTQGKQQAQTTSAVVDAVSQGQTTMTPSVLAAQTVPNQTSAPSTSQPPRKTRTANGTSISGTIFTANDQTPTGPTTLPTATGENETNVLNAQSEHMQNGNSMTNTIVASNVQPTSVSRDTFLSDDEDSNTEDRFEPWQFEYTPISNLKYADKKFEAHIGELVADFVEEERENLNFPNGSHNSASATDDGIERASIGSRRESPFSAFSRPGSARPSLLGASSVLSGISSANRLASPAPSSGSSTPAYSSSAVISALTPPTLPTILPDPPISTSEFSSKLAIKPLASSSMSLAPPACTPFSGPTCVPSLMNPYPRPTVHGVFTNTNLTAGSLITFMQGEVISGEQYRSDPVNQWHDLGLLKDHTRGLAQPWDLVLDQRRFSDESRFLRNGCHPNVFIKPVIVRKRSKTGDISAISIKKGRSIARKKAELQRAVKEGAEFEVVLGLYALQDIAKRDELVLPFDWADDHVVHSLHTLLFSPSLVFPSIPSNVHSGESETEDDGIPSTSSFTYLSTSQKAQIAQCSKHLYRLSRLASQTCITLFGTSICACEKRRDCSIAWLWKLACFSESSSARNRGIIRLQDFDLNGLRLACASALATDENQWMPTVGANGKLSHKKSSTKKRRADLGALVGLFRGWEKEEIEPVTAIPPQGESEKAFDRHNSELAEHREQVEGEQGAKQEEEHMQVDQFDDHGRSDLQGSDSDVIEVQLKVPIADNSLHTGKPDPDSINDYSGDAVSSAANLKDPDKERQEDQMDSQFNFVVPEVTTEPRIEQPSTIVDTPENTATEALLQVPEQKAKDRSPNTSRPNTAGSAAVSEAISDVVKPAEESDSDITEPLPSDASDGEGVPNVKRSPVRKSPIKANKGPRRKLQADPAGDENMEADEEDVVRPPKKKVLRRKDQDKEGSRTVKRTKDISSKAAPDKVKREGTVVAKKEDSSDMQGSTKKLMRIKTKLDRASDRSTSSAQKDKSAIGTGLPSFQTKKQIQEKAKRQAAAKDAEMEASKQMHSTAGTSTASTTVEPSAIAPTASSAKADENILTSTKIQSESQTASTGPDLDSLFSMEVEPANVPEPVASADIPVQSSPAQPTPLEPIKSEDVDTTSVVEIAPTVSTAVEEAEAPESLSTVTTVATPAPPSAAPLRRVSFQAYKKRVSTVPLREAQAPDDQVPLPASTVQGSTADGRALDASESKPSQTILDGNLVQTPTTEKSSSGLGDAVATPGNDTNLPTGDVKRSPETGVASLPGSTPTAAQSKARLSFAAYRSRITTGSEVSPKVLKLELPTVTEAEQIEEPVSSAKGASSNVNEEVSPKIITDLDAPAEKEVSKAEIGHHPAESITKNADVHHEQEQEEGELFVDPNLEPGEVEGGMQVDDDGHDNRALGLHLGQASSRDDEPSYTPPSRNRTLSPKADIVVKKEPLPNDARLVAQAASAQRLANVSRKEAEANSSATKAQDQSGSSKVISNTNWTNASGGSPPSRPDDLPTGPRVPFRGSSPSRPRGFSRSSRHGSPPSRGGAALPPSNSRPPSAPRGGYSTRGWGGRGRATGISGTPRGRGPPGREAGFGGSSYAYSESGHYGHYAGASRGHPPPSAPRADREPPSGPRALQGPPIFSRGRGRPEAPPGNSSSSRDKGWGGRGRGRGVYSPPWD